MPACWAPCPENRKAGRGSGQRLEGRLLQHDMDVGATDAERAHPGPAGGLAPAPIHGMIIDEERAALEVDLRIGPLEMQAGWNRLVLERQHCLDETRDTGGGVQMADIGLE